jgi:hypothetical protein
VGPDRAEFSDEAGQRLDGSALRRRFIVARDPAGLRPLRLHELRHTLASLAIDLTSRGTGVGRPPRLADDRSLHVLQVQADEAQRLARAFGSGPGVQPHG